VNRAAATATEVLAYDAGHTTVISVAAALLLGSTFPLVICAVTVYRRLRRLGVLAPGPLMGVAGALLAATALAATTVFSWTATQTAGLGDPALARALTHCRSRPAASASSHPSACSSPGSPYPH